MTVLASSGFVVLVLAFGAGFVGIGVLLAGLVAMLEGEDRRKLLTLLRHPLRTAFSEREEDADEEGD